MGKGQGLQIIIKKSGKDPRRFFTEVDKNYNVEKKRKVIGSANPAFCHPQQIAAFKEQTRKDKEMLDSGLVVGSKRQQYQQKIKKRLDHESLLDESVDNAKKIIAEDPDGWSKLREDLGKEIRKEMPSRNDTRLRKTNPHTMLKKDKEGGLEQVKRAYIHISRALGEESDISTLRREK